MTQRATQRGVLLVSTILLSGCPLFQKPAQDQDKDQDAATDPAKYTEEVDAKLRRYSACRDTAASVLADSWERYSDQVGTDGKPKRRREGVYLRAVSTNSFRNCRRVIAAPTIGISMPVIEKSTVELVDAASTYADLTGDLEKYLSAEGWKNDDWAKLQTIDVKLRAAHERWTDADQILQQALDLRHVENDQLLLGVLEQRASALEFASRRVMVYARPLVRCLEREPAPVVEECRRLFEEFDSVQEEFIEIHAADAGADKVFWMRTFANDVGEFREAAGEVVRRIGQRGGRVEDLQGVRDAHSSLVRDAETLDFDFP